MAKVLSTCAWGEKPRFSEKSWVELGEIEEETEFLMVGCVQGYYQFPNYQFLNYQFPNYQLMLNFQRQAPLDVTGAIAM